MFCLYSENVFANWENAGLNPEMFYLSSENKVMISETVCRVSESNF